MWCGVPRYHGPLMLPLAGPVPTRTACSLLVVPPPCRPRSSVIGGRFRAAARQRDPEEYTHIPSRLHRPAPLDPQVAQRWWYAYLDTAMVGGGSPSLGLAFASTCAAEEPILAIFQESATSMLSVKKKYALSSCLVPGLRCRCRAARHCGKAKLVRMVRAGPDNVGVKLDRPVLCPRRRH